MEPDLFSRLSARFHCSSVTATCPYRRENEIKANSLLDGFFNLSKDLGFFNLSKDLGFTSNSNMGVDTSALGLPRGLPDADLGTPRKRRM
ncbi:hypothetical protein H9Q70_009859 [Fusarium xylarioides]|nr:hypothetical protein H9Q70_009859 [Fusarium xylarioides]